MTLLGFHWVLLHPIVSLEARAKCASAYKLTLWLEIAAFSM